jgi:hypothetical protein
MPAVPRLAPPVVAPLAPSPVSTTKVNGLAIASLVLSLVWVWGIGSILAIVFGEMAIKQIDQTGEGGAGLANAGRIVGVAGLVLVIVLLVAAFGSGS